MCLPDSVGKRDRGGKDGQDEGTQTAQDADTNGKINRSSTREPGSDRWRTLVRKRRESTRIETLLISNSGKRALWGLLILTGGANSCHQ